ncbi:TPA: hypothetical protein QFD67_001534 [Enterococcus faecium]
MLGQFLEQSIYRQVFLCEQLYELQEINVREMGNLLGVCSGTVINDLGEISEKLWDYIDDEYKKRNKYGIIFKRGVSLTDVTQILYSESYFLRGLKHFFEGNFTSIHITESDHVSLSKAYDIKNMVYEFFDYYGYTSNNQIVIPELDYRYLLMMLIHLTDWEGYQTHNDRIKKFSEELIEYVECHFFNRTYKEIDKYLVYRGIEIGALRNKKSSISISEIDKINARKQPLYKFVVEGIQEVYDINKISEDEIFYIFTLFNTKDYSSENIEFLLKDFDVVYSAIVIENQKIFELKKILEKEFGESLFDSLIFKKAFINFSRTLWGNIQKYVVTPICLLDKEKQKIKQRLVKCLNLWKLRNSFVYFNSNMVNSLVFALYLSRSMTILD